MFCGKCGNKVLDGYEFCMNCGTKVEQEVATIDSKEDKPTWKGKIISTKNKMAIIVVIIFLISIGAGVILIGFGSPIKNVSNEIYKEAVDNVNYFKSLQVESSEEMKSAESQINDKYEQLLAKCSNDDERTFVKKAREISNEWLVLKGLKLLSEIAKALNPNANHEEIAENFSEALKSLEESHNRLLNAKNIADL